jgi:formylglycine-generating enzyme required for sulfatase activity
LENIKVQLLPDTLTVAAAMHRKSYDAAVPSNAAKRVIRGGSFSCNQSYCMSYRPSARRGLDPFNAMSHVGFRLVKDK